MSYSFCASRGGHAPNRLRDAFYELVYTLRNEAEPIGLTSEIDVEEHRCSVAWLLGQLWNCTDILPSHVRTDMHDILRIDDECFTYSQGVRRIKTLLS